MPLEIRKTKPMPSRPCRWCLALQNDSVFADFDVDSEGCVFLARISFDGYGCCETGRRIRSMDREMSGSFLQLLEADEVRAKEMAELLYRYFQENNHVIWRDALEEHAFVNN